MRFFIGNMSGCNNKQHLIQICGNGFRDNCDTDDEWNDRVKLRLFNCSLKLVSCDKPPPLGKLLAKMLGKLLLPKIHFIAFGRASHSETSPWCLVLCLSAYNMASGLFVIFHSEWGRWRASSFILQTYLIPSQRVVSGISAIRYRGAQSSKSWV